MPVSLQSVGQATVPLMPDRPPGHDFFVLLAALLIAVVAAVSPLGRFFAWIMDCRYEPFCALSD